MYKKLGLTFDEFINRPLSEIETIIRCVDEFDKKKMKVSENIMKGIEKEQKNLTNDLE